MKVDVALPLAVFETVVELAEKSDAPIHHRSHERVLSPTILHLIRLGIQSLEDNPELLSANLSTSATDPRVPDLVDRVGKLEDRLIPITDELVSLQSQLDKLLAMPTNQVRFEIPPAKPQQVEGKGLTVGEMNRLHGLSIKRDLPTSEILAALKEAGLGDRYQYKSATRTFTELDKSDSK